MRFFAHAADRGGYNAMKPVLELALTEGHEVILYLSVTCAKQHQEGKLPPIVELENIGRVHIFHPDIPINQAKHDFCLVGSSQSDEGSTAALEFIQLSGTPTVLIEDYYGSSLPTLALFGQLNVPHYLHVCVGDEQAKSNVVDSRLMNFVGGNASQRVHVTGLPHFHDLISRIKPRWQEIRTEIRQAFNIEKDHLVFLIAGQHNGTAEAVGTICLALDSLHGKFGYLLIRQHPGATALDKRLTRWVFAGGDSEICSPYKFIMADVLQNLPHEYAAQTEMLLPATDFVISGYSTSLRYAAICGITGTVSLGTPSFVYDLRCEKGLDVPPEVMAGAIWYAKNEKDLLRIISLVLAENPGEEVKQIQSNQAKMATLNDDQAARRILDLALAMVAPIKPA